MKQEKEPELKENFAYVCFHKGKGLIGRFIGLWTLGDYAHVELIYNGKKYLANPGGVRCEDYIYKPHHDLYELNYIVDIEKLMDFFEATEGFPYDFRALYKSQFLMGKDRDKDQNPNEYFCSEWLLAALDYATNYKYTYKGKGINEKGYFKFNPERLYKYLREMDLLVRKVDVR